MAKYNELTGINLLQFYRLGQYRIFINYTLIAKTTVPLICYVFYFSLFPSFNSPCRGIIKGDFVKIFFKLLFTFNDITSKYS